MQKYLKIGGFLVLFLLIGAGCSKGVEQVPVEQVVPALETEQLNEDVAVEEVVPAEEKEELQEENQEIMPSQKYTLDTTNSQLNWSASHVAGGGHTGSVDLKSGLLMKEKGFFDSGEFIIDMQSIDDDKESELFLKHIRSEDFFNVENFPETKFVLTFLKQIELELYEVEGNLTILDKTKEISFQAKTIDEGGVFNVKADFDIDRTRWGINFKSGSIFKELGDKAIKDDISFNLDLNFILAE